MLSHVHVGSCPIIARTLCNMYVMIVTWTLDENERNLTYADACVFARRPRFVADYKRSNRFHTPHSDALRKREKSHELGPARYSIGSSKE